MDVHLRLQQVFREVFDDDELEIHDHTTAKDIPEWDSLMHVSLLVAIEGEFGIRFASAEVSGLKNVGELRGVVETKMG
ncbi:MAG: acyl carrier protein [Alphaproteobacteria bacterium]|nr:acyl carrier protein [Alphaproteobacteria bacterium]